MTILLRPGQRILNIPGIGVRMSRRAVSGGAAAWWLEGGVAAANAIAVYQPKGAASIAASYDNIAAPGNGLADGTYDAAPGTAPTHASATGWTFNGTNQYLTTGLVPSNTSWSMIASFASITSANSFALGCQTAGLPGQEFALVPSRLSFTGVAYANCSRVVSTSAKIISGTMAVAGQSCYLNGVLDAVSAVGTAPTDALFLGSLNLGGSPSLYFNGKILAFAIYNTTLTAPQVLAISSAMALL